MIVLGKSVISIWTDGSSHNNGEKKGLGGYGAVLIYGQLPINQDELYSHYGDDKKTLEIYGGHSETTNQQMEIKAVTEALKRVKKGTSTPIHIFSDSAYVVNCMNDKWYQGWMTNGWKNSKKEPVANREYWEELLSVMNENWFDVSFHKVKGHKGIFYNEWADKLAGKGTKDMEIKFGF